MPPARSKPALDEVEKEPGIYEKFISKEIKRVK
jgi:hypothetical protein